MKVATAAQMRAIDTRACIELGIPRVVLMEAAGVCFARACVEEMGGLTVNLRVLIACGPGNNGGDGFVAARHLAALGARVTVFVAGRLADATGEAAIHAVPIRHIPEIKVVEIAEDAPFAISASGPFDLVGDCLLGTGARLPLTGRMASLVEQLNVQATDCRCPLVACDVPTGVDADRGTVTEPAIHATRTVTFGTAKPGLLFFPGAEYVGRLSVVCIGIPSVLTDDLPTSLTMQTDLKALLPMRSESRDANKGSFGTVLVVAGSAGMAGASALSALSALRAGCGLVILAVPESLLDTAAALAPEAVLRGLPETASRAHGGLGALEAAFALAESADAVAIGPGMGSGKEVIQFIQEFVRGMSKPLVVDADGLNALARAPVVLSERGAPTVLTPHPGELGRLMGVETSAIQVDRVAAAREAAERYGATVLLKGSRTLIAEPGGRLAINRRGTVALATAGSGDVLTGVIGALLGQKLSAFDAARAGAYLHALAGESAAGTMGNVGVLAGDVRDNLPFARQKLYEQINLDEV